MLTKQKLLNKIQKAENDIKAGKGLTTKAVRKKLKKWLS